MTALVNTQSHTVEKLRFPIKTALPIALSIKERLESCCDRVMIAGSIRRERKEVGDIEILCIPKKVLLQTGLFGGTYENDPSFVRVVDSFEKIKGNAASGSYMQRIHPSGIKIDFFTGTAESWGWQSIVRTGPADFSHRMAIELNHRGMTSEKFAIHRISDKKFIPCEMEQDFFKLIGMQFILPMARI